MCSEVEKAFVSTFKLNPEDTRIKVTFAERIFTEYGAIEPLLEKTLVFGSIPLSSAEYAETENAMLPASSPNTHTLNLFFTFKTSFFV